MAPSDDDLYKRALAEGWKTPRPTDGDPKREPGPYNVHRYLFAGTAAGVGTTGARLPTLFGGGEPSAVKSTSC